MKQCLLLVDIQNDYFKNGKVELVGMEEAALNAKVLLHKFRERNETIIHIQHIATKAGATFFLPGTNGAEINKIVFPEADETIIEKHFPNSFRETSLLQVLKENGIEELIICGAMSHMCIDTTTRAAFDFGFNCVVIKDACATRDLVFDDETIEARKVQNAFMAALSGTFARVVSTSGYMQLNLEL